MTFRWPWVSRRAYDVASRECVRLEARADGDALSYAAAIDRERDRYEKLVGEMLTLKREGYAPAERPTVAVAEPDLPGKIDDAIDEVAQSASEAARLRVLARRWLAEGVENNEVRRRVFDGETVDVEGDA